MTPEEKKEYKKQYYQKNKYKREQYDKEYRLNNKDKQREYQKTYKDKNKDTYKEYSKGWRLNNKNKIKEDNKIYNELNPLKKIMNACNMHTKKHPNLERITEEQLKYLYFNTQKGKCSILNKRFSIYDLSLDHIVPVSKGGTNDISNLQFVFWRLNHAKYDSSEKEFQNDLNIIVNRLDPKNLSKRIIKYQFNRLTSACNDSRIILKYTYLNKIATKQLKDLYYNKQNSICPITLLELPIEQMSLDHIVPISKGGTNDISNLRLIYWRLNFAKMDLTEEQFQEDWNMIKQSYIYE